MKLIAELRNDILSAEIGLAVALRKAKVLASILRDEDFKQWVNYELNGYPDDAELPKYRMTTAQTFGTFTGAFGAGANNVAVPIHMMSSEFKEQFGKDVFPMGVKQLESMLEGDGKVLIRRWPGEAVALWNIENKDSGGFALVGARSDIPKSTIEGILDTTRNRLLDFILELTEINPEIMESESAITSIPSDTVQNIFNLTVHGNNNVVAGGTSVHQEVTQSISSYDQDALINFFRTQGIPEDDLTELDHAIQEDGEVEKGNYGKNVQAWIGKMTVKAAQGVWKVALDTAPKILTSGLSDYYGWNS